MPQVLVTIVKYISLPTRRANDRATNDTAITQQTPIAVFGTAGMPGKSAQSVAKDVMRQARAWYKGGWPVSEHLADQLILPLLFLAGGTFRTGPLSMHTRSVIAVCQAFGASITCHE